MLRSVLDGLKSRVGKSTPASPAKPPVRLVRRVPLVRVHAVRRASAPSPERVTIDEYDRTSSWFAVELTFTPGSGATPSTPFGITLVDPNEAAGEGAWGVVYMARHWTGDEWREAAELMLGREVRLRLLVAIRYGAPGVLSVYYGGFRCGTVDQSRADLPLIGDGPADRPDTSADEEDDEDEADRCTTPGECVKCGDMNLVNAAGLCANCKGLPPCRNHPESASLARCMKCRKPFCDDCLDGGKCIGCLAAGGGESQPRKRKKGAKGGEPEVNAAIAGREAAKGLGIKLSRNQQLALGLALVVALKGIHFGYEWYTLQPPALTEAQLAIRDMETVKGALDAMSQKGGLPKKAAAIVDFMKSQQIPDAPKVVDAGAPPEPKAVVFQPDGKGYKLTQYDAEGKVASRDGQPIVVTSDSD